MFGSRDIDISGIVTTSKMSLKASCIRVCGSDIEKAEKLYDFFAKDIKDLPDFDIPPPSTYEQIKGIAGEIFGWVDQNQDKLVGAYNLIQGLRGGNPLPTNAGPPAGIQPIPE
jgi:hypothetical protein